MPKRRDDPRRIARLRGLMDQLRAEAGDERGAQRIVAKRLGVHPNTISKALDGTRGPGADMIFALWTRLGIPVDYFVCPGPDHIDYREYLRTRTEGPAQVASAVAALAAEVRDLREAQQNRDEAESGPRLRVASDPTSEPDEDEADEAFDPSQALRKAAFVRKRRPKEPK